MKISAKLAVLAAILAFGSVGASHVNADLTLAGDLEQIVEVAVHHLQTHFHCGFVLLLPADQGLVFLALRTNLGERHFHAGQHIESFSCSVQRARGEREIDGKRVALLPRTLFDLSVQFHQVRSITLKQFVQLRRLPMRFLIDELAPFFLRRRWCRKALTTATPISG